MHNTHSRHLMMVHIQECSLEQSWKWNIILNDFSYLLGSITTDDTGLLWIICMEKTKKNWKFNKTFAIYRIKTGNGINSKYHGRVIKISIYAMQHCSWILLGMQSAMLKRLAMKKISTNCARWGGKKQDKQFLSFPFPTSNRLRLNLKWRKKRHLDPSSLVCYYICRHATC